MVDPTSNDNDPFRSNAALPVPDAHGQAAMLLVESLIHGLIARSALTTAEAIDIVRVAAEVKVDVAASLGDTPAVLRKSLLLLEAIEASLAIDHPRN